MPMTGLLAHLKRFASRRYATPGAIKTSGVPRLFQADRKGTALRPQPVGTKRLPVGEDAGFKVPQDIRDGNSKVPREGAREMLAGVQN